MKRILLFITFSFFTITCSNLDGSEPSPRNTFLKFYQGPYSITATGLELTPDGYVVVGNMFVEDNIRDTTYTSAVVFKTNTTGNKTLGFKEIAGGTGKSIKAIRNGANVSGYVIVGDRIIVNPLEPLVANISISSLRGAVLDPNFEITRTFTITDETPVPAPPQINETIILEDFTGEAIDVAADGKVYILGTSKKAVTAQQVAPAEPFLIALNADGTLNWTKRYDLLGRTSQNSKSIHYSNGRITWAAAIADVAGDFINSWVSIPTIEENSVYPNYSVYGQNSQQYFVPKDICLASSPAFGFAVVGTYSETQDGSKGNIFFMTVRNDGTINASSLRYFDGVNSDLLTDRNVSITEDRGEAITSTQDGGFVLAGSAESQNNKDLVLIKVDAAGNVVWTRRFGGAGDEVPTAIRETPEGDLIICGTNTLGNFATVFLLKTNRNGELKD
ncbi:MAG: hypothetical protein BroJett042_03280 [Bacteroidota bacterium]|nr:MAG: lipoprotein [Bacteroidetes bacterium OLB12]GIL21815.1 MAG: hypothetical protein BroJett042_03280 [Bacteroidota bacterium]HNR75231.1 hypothetical protein [Cyclobacteriaceae bacterium]HNU41759.1 hypothetical protein [Cyclobacteriaceae bacterium]